MRSLVGAPLCGLRERGALFLTSTREQGFSHDDLVVLGLSAERAATAVAHARSYERERGFVEVLQDHLLPDRLPQLPGLSLAARYRPSERLAQVGGDWYDVIQLPDGGLGVAIGDVVGHGVGAATMMAELRSALRAYAIVAPQSPARAIGALNALVAPIHRQMIATLLYVVLDEESGRCRFASAGHLPPLVLGADGTGRYVRHRAAPPLGVSAHTAYLDNGFELAPGETLLLYTDGLIERRDEGIDLGFRRLEQLLRDAPADLEALCDHALRASDDHAGPRDDVALIALRRLARSQDVLDLTLPAEPESVPTARHRLERWLERCGAGADLSADLLLAANEACTNAVVHAYGPRGRDTFRVTAGRNGSRILIRVTDRGSWRTPRGSEGGRGLQLIGRLVDALDVSRTGEGTTVTMRTTIERDGRG
jgi:serine phosphatase RsbU (regulator of sigma subunit)/anti-sigma regulatory factor (Ser/Thr protein kinase)